MGYSKSAFQKRLAKDQERFQEMKEKALMYRNTPEEFRDKKKQKFRKRKLPFTK